MSKTPQEIKDLVLWMRDQGVSSFRVDAVEVNFAPEAFMKSLVGKDAAPPEQEISDEQRKKEEDDLLYHSAG